MLSDLHQDVDEDKIREVFAEFTGKIFQLPPVKSAVKREMRTRNIYYSTIYEIEGRDVLFRIGCEAGTYVRTYCHNIGEALGLEPIWLSLEEHRSVHLQKKTI